MASNVVQRQLTTPKKVNFARLCRLIVDLLTPILRDILLKQYPPEALQEKIEGNRDLECEFRRDMSTILNGSGYETCDISLLYNLIRRTCSLKVSVTSKRKGWGGNIIPPRGCIELGDDVDRIRVIRNKVYSHAYTTDIEDGILQKYFDISSDICQRMAEKIGMRYYVHELETIKTCRMEHDEIVKLSEKVQESIDKNEDLFNFVRKETARMSADSARMSADIDELRREIKHLKVQGFRSEDFFQRNKKGDIEILTGYAKDILIKLQTGVYSVYSFRD